MSKFENLCAFMTSYTVWPVWFLFQTKINLHEIVFWSVNNFIADLGKDPDMRCKTIFETPAKIP
jgi:hypothetical protein